MAKPIDCSLIGVIVKFGSITCYDDGTVTSDGPSVIWSPRLASLSDGRAKRIGEVQRRIVELMSKGLHTKDELATALGLSKDTVSYSVSSLIRKGVVTSVAATDGGPCRSYYFLVNQDIARYLEERGLRRCGS